MSSALLLSQALQRMPLVAILRGLEPVDARRVGTTLVKAGFEVLEVPLNSPDSYDSIRILCDTVGDRAVVGGGTVVSIEGAERVRDAGGRIAVAPNTDVAVIEACLDLGLVPVPGFATPSEALRALHSGAGILKLFPADAFPRGYLRALGAVMPPRTPVLAVGGVDADNARAYLEAGFLGLGVGSSLFRPGRTVEELQQAAAALVRVCHDWRRGKPTPPTGTASPVSPRPTEPDPAIEP